MPRDRSALRASLEGLIAQEMALAGMGPDDIFHIFYPTLSQDIALCIDTIDRQIIADAETPGGAAAAAAASRSAPSRPPSPHSPSSPRTPLKSHPSIKVFRFQQVTIYSHQIGLYDIYITRPARKGRSDYPGLATGARKIFKRGVQFFKIQEIPENSCHFEVRERKKYLSLVQKSDSYQADLSQLWALPETSEEYARILRACGYDPEITSIIQRPSSSNAHMRNIVLVEDKGEPLNNLSLTNEVFACDDTEMQIANAILAAGSKNPPLLIPFDTKLANILCRKIGEEAFEFRCIDYTEPGTTLPYIPTSLLEALQLLKVFGLEFARENLANIYRSASEKPPEELLLPHVKDSPTFFQAALMLAAEEIISTYVCFMCGGTDTVETVKKFVAAGQGQSLENNPKFIEDKLKIIEFIASAEGLNLPNLFILKPDLSAQIQRGIDRERINIREALAGRAHAGRNWVRMLQTCFLS